MAEETVPSAAPSPSPPSPVREIVWGLISTALLALWIAWSLGWIWALAGVIGVLVHECGHILAINASGSGPGRLHIVPFFGGAASWETPPSTEFKGVLIALAGPVFGLLAMAPFFVAYVLTGEHRWLGGAFFIAIINLLNLAPAPPLDGSKALGPALARIHPWFERAAMVTIGALAVLWAISRGEYLIALFIALSALRAFAPGRLRPWSRRLSLPECLGSIALYAAAVVICALAVGVVRGSAGVSILDRVVGG